ncbi:MAG: DoxX family protein [Alphaproteobacteria bacterium]
MTALDPYFKAIGRVLLTLIFLWSVVGKIFSYAGVQGYMAKFGVPGELLPLVILVELVGGLAILVGWNTRWAALALAGFCVVSAVLFHNEFGDKNQLIHFLKNLGLAGGFLVLAAARPGALSLDKR